MTLRGALVLLVIALVMPPGGTAWAHHVLGRPSYQLSGDSTTPPSIVLDVQIGQYNATMMAFPLELKAKQPGRIKLYATRLDTAVRFNGAVTFLVRDDSWWPAPEETLGVRTIDDNGVYAQDVEFSRDGNYIVTAKYVDGGEPYIIDFPVTVGKPLPVVPLTAAAGAVILVLGGVSLLKRRASRP